MDTDTSAPHFGKAPTRISDNTDGRAKSGFSVYGRWQFADPESVDPNVWRRGLPDGGATCFNVAGDKVCDRVSRRTFPPSGEAPGCPFRVA